MNKIESFVKTRWKWIIFAIVLVIFLAIAEDVFEQEIMKVDTIAYTFAVEKLRSNWLTKIMNFITNLGGAYAFLIVCLTAEIILKNKKIGITMFINLVLIFGLNLLLKYIVQRPRPDGYRLIAESGYSFPSGHSMASTAFYGLIIYYIYTNIKNKKLKYILCILLSILIVLIGFSRVYLGVHYASDVIAGALVSIAYLICVITLYKNLSIKNQLKNN